jgi:hypothetical protein
MHDAVLQTGEICAPFAPDLSCVGICQGCWRSGPRYYVCDRTPWMPRKRQRRHIVGALQQPGAEYPAADGPCNVSTTAASYKLVSPQPSNIKDENVYPRMGVTCVPFPGFLHQLHLVGMVMLVLISSESCSIKA